MDNLARDILSVNEAIAGRAAAVAGGTDGAAEIIWASAEMGEVLNLVRKVASRPVTVLLMGETGTGKSMLAHAIHRDSPRRARPFIAQNCGALPEALCESELFGYRRGAFSGAVQDRHGLFEAHDGGTIFLDEVSELSPAMQVKLLQVLQDGTFRRVGDTKSRCVDVRVISATNKDLAAEVEAGRFRCDLYYRLNIVPILIPPLRARRGEIPALARNFLQKHCGRLNPTVTSIMPEAMQALCAYDYPGNVRELENLIERALCMSTGPALEIGFPAFGVDPCVTAQRPREPSPARAEDRYTQVGNTGRSAGAVVLLRRPGRCRAGTRAALAPAVGPRS
ncbi:MAG: sigma-54 interaction domain-containing protein [Gammaproteobacteria bacterium]